MAIVWDAFLVILVEMLFRSQQQSKNPTCLGQKELFQASNKHVKSLHSPRLRWLNGLYVCSPSSRRAVSVNSHVRFGCVFLHVKNTCWSWIWLVLAMITRRSDPQRSLTWTHPLHTMQTTLMCFRRGAWREAWGWGGIVSWIFSKSTFPWADSP